MVGHVLVQQDEAPLQRKPDDRSPGGKPTHLLQAPQYKREQHVELNNDNNVVQMRVSRTGPEILPQLSRHIGRRHIPGMSCRHFQNKIQQREHHIRHNNVRQPAAVELSEGFTAQRAVDVIVEQHKSAQEHKRRYSELAEFVDEQKRMKH
ncbi:hypothetical protein D3C73_1077990 [compost metagenome]